MSFCHKRDSRDPFRDWISAELDKNNSKSFDVQSLCGFYTRCLAPFVSNYVLLNQAFDEYPDEKLSLPPLLREISADCVQRTLKYVTSIHYKWGEFLGETAKPFHISVGDSDLHNNGQFVFLLSQAGGTVAVKPRKPDLERMLGTVLTEFSAGLRIPEIIGEFEGGYWQAFVEPAPRLSFYPEHGASLGTAVAVLQCLGAIDFHKENVLFSHSGLHVVDGETLFHQPQPGGRKVAVNDKFLEAFDTPLNTGLLPVWRTDPNNVLTCSSGLFGVSASESFRSDDLRLLASEMAEAYRSFFRAKANHRRLIEIMTSEGLLQSRVVKRPTAVYAAIAAKVIMRCYYLSRGEFEADLFELLWSSGGASYEQCLQEARSLSIGEIPFFCTETTAEHRKAYIDATVESCLQNLDHNYSLVRAGVESMGWSLAQAEKAAISDQAYLL